MIEFEISKKQKTSSRKLFAEVCICIRQSIEFMFKAINWFLRYGKGLIYTIYKFKCGLCAKLYIMHEERNYAKHFLINYLSLTCWAEMCFDQFIRVKRRLIYIFWYDRETLINKWFFFFFKLCMSIKKPSWYWQNI